MRNRENQKRMTSIILAPRTNSKEDWIKVVAWHVGTDDFVNNGQKIVELKGQSLNSVVEVSAETDGYIRPLVEQGTVLQTGSPLFICASTHEELEATARISMNPKGTRVYADGMPPSSNTSIRCDTCGIDLATYYRDFRRNAFMLAYYREDGTLGSVCHLCQEGWNK
jgi:hypothetical protein